LKIEFEIKTKIFVHSINNPPTERLGCNIDIKILEENEFSLSKFGKIDKYRAPPKTEYILEIFNPLKIGFSSGEKSKVTQDLKNLVMSFNLSLCRSCITDSNITFSTQDIKFKSMKLKTEIEKVGNKLIAHSEDVLILSDDYYNWTSMSENVNEKYILDIFQKLQRLNRFGIKSNLRLTNLIKSLSEYEMGMKENSRLFIFKHLFNALEIAINIDSERTGEMFDKSVEAHTGIPEATVERWRGLYNRIKHVDKSSNHNSAYMEGTKKVTSMIVPIRNSAKKAIMTILKNT
jgi:hypothetical protein